MLEYRAPLPLLAAATSPTSCESDGLHVIQLSGRALLLLQSRCPYEQLNGVLRPVLGLDLPRDLQASRPEFESVRREPGQPHVEAALWLGPGQWLLELPCSRVRPVLTRLEETLQATAPPAPTALLDCSDAWCHLEVNGPQVTAALARSCSLDLSLGGFPLDRVARTSIAEVGTVLWRLEAQRFRCLIERGLAQHWFDWLQQW